MPPSTNDPTAAVIGIAEGRGKHSYGSLYSLEAPKESKTEQEPKEENDTKAKAMTKIAKTKSRTRVASSALHAFKERSKLQTAVMLPRYS